LALDACGLVSFLDEARLVDVGDRVGVGEAAGGEGEELGGEVVGVDPGEDEESAVVGDEVEVVFSLVGGPPIQRSRGPRLQAAAPKPRRARSRPSVRAT